MERAAQAVVDPLGLPRSAQADGDQRRDGEQLEMASHGWVLSGEWNRPRTWPDRIAASTGREMIPLDRAVVAVFPGLT